MSIHTDCFRRQPRHEPGAAGDIENTQPWPQVGKLHNGGPHGPNTAGTNSRW